MPSTSPEQLRDILTTVRTIALVGASEKTSRPSHEVMEYLQSQGYRILPVNPRLAGQTVLGETVYADLRSLPEPVDMVDLFLAPERTETSSGLRVSPKRLPVIRAISSSAASTWSRAPSG